MSKGLLFPLLLALGCSISGMYGALHDQISYSVSHEYFHEFKFRQFQIQPALHNRLGASLVGWYATWWMGLVIGVPVLLIARSMPDAKSFASRSLVAFAVVALTALTIGVAALAYASAHTTDANLPPYRYPEGVVNRPAFARVGTMHNFSYLGGFAGIITASMYLLIERKRLNRRPPY